MREIQLPAREGSQRGASIDLADELRKLRLTLERGLSGPSLGCEAVDRVREALNKHFSATGRFPDFLDIGTSVFDDLYDWHVRERQPIHIIRLSEQRFGIQFQYTQLIVRWEGLDPRYIGIPY